MKHVIEIFRASDKKKIARLEIYAQDVTGAEQDLVILDSDDLKAAAVINLQPGYDRYGE